MATRWSTAEDQLLRRLYADQLPVEQIAGRLARSPDAVVARRQALGIAPRLPSRPWSPREQALLRAGSATGLPAPLLAQRLGRSTKQVRARRRTLVAPPPPARPYLAHEDKAIRVCLAERGDLVALGRRLGRSPDAVRLHAEQLGIYRPTPRARFTPRSPLDGRGRRAAAPASRPEPRAARRAARPLRRRRVPTVMCAGTTRQRSRQTTPRRHARPAEIGCGPIRRRPH